MGFSGYVAGVSISGMMTYYTQGGKRAGEVDKVTGKSGGKVPGGGLGGGGRGHQIDWSSR